MKAAELVKDRSSPPISIGISLEIWNWWIGSFGHFGPPRHSRTPQHPSVLSLAARPDPLAAASTPCIRQPSRPTAARSTRRAEAEQQEDDQSPRRCAGQRSITQPRPTPTAIPAMNSLESLSAAPTPVIPADFGSSFPSRLSGRLVARDASRSSRRRSRSSSRPSAPTACPGPDFPVSSGRFSPAIATSPPGQPVNRCPLQSRAQHS